MCTYFNSIHCHYGYKQEFTAKKYRYQGLKKTPSVMQNLQLDFYPDAPAACSVVQQIQLK